jgi:cytochrome c
MNANKILAALAAVAAVSFGAGSAVAQDAAAGERVFNKCKACHTIEEGGPPRVGPNLYGIYGATAGSNEAFQARYSPNLKAADFTWNEETLTPYLKNPKDVIEGSRMTFQLRNDQEIADVIAYLKEQGGQ